MIPPKLPWVQGPTGGALIGSRESITLPLTEDMA